METINSTTYPICAEWVFKEGALAYLRSLALTGIIVYPLFLIMRASAPDGISGIFAAVWFFVFAFFALGPLVGTVFLWLRRINFTYSFDEKFLTIEQGIIAKQKRYIPYAVFQNVLIMQSLTDTLFGFATLRIENASGAGMVLPTIAYRPGGFSSFGSRSLGGASLNSFLGAAGNMVNIPGLALKDAQKLKQEVLLKIVQTAHLDQSGL